MPNLFEIAHAATHNDVTVDDHWVSNNVLEGHIQSSLQAYL